MGYSGWLIVLLLALLGVYVTPALIRIRQHQVDNPVEDRFSKGLLVVDIAKTCPRVHGESGNLRPRLVPQAKIDLSTGEWSLEMDQKTAAGRQRVSRSAEAERQLSKIRSERRARLANEAVVGKRRLLVAALSLILLIGLSFGAYAQTLAAAWLSIPGLTLAAVLVDGRLAYQRSMRATEAETKAMERIRSKEDIARRQQQRRGQQTTELVDGAVSFGNLQVTLPTAETPAETVKESVGSVEVAQTQTAHQETQDALVGVHAKGAVKQTQVSASAQAMLDSLEAPAITSKSAVVRRRTQPLHEAAEVSTPTASKRRPVEARPLPASALTSAEVAQVAAEEQSRKVLDVDQILDLRRAQ